MLKSLHLTSAMPLAILLFYLHRDSFAVVMLSITTIRSGSVTFSGRAREYSNRFVYVGSVPLRA